MPEEKTDHDKLTEIHAVLLGTNGYPGIAKQVEKNTRAIHRIWIAITIIATSIGGGVYGVVELINKIAMGS